MLSNLILTRTGSKILINVDTRVKQLKLNHVDKIVNNKCSHELKIILDRKQQKRRPIKLYKKTDWAGFRNEMEEYQKTFQENFSASATNTKWSEF